MSISTLQPSSGGSGHPKEIVGRPKNDIVYWWAKVPSISTVFPTMFIPATRPCWSNHTGKLTVFTAHA